MPINITMPRLSDTMEAGTIIKWNVKEGDTVSAGDVVADVETDKATMEMQSFDDGTIARILVAEGKAVDVGTVIAVLAEEGEDAGSIEAPKADAAPAQEKPAEPAAAPAAEPAAAPAAEPAAQAAPAQETPVQDAPAQEAPAAPSAAAAPAQAVRQPSDHVRVSPVARHLADDYGLDLNVIQGSGPGGRIIKRDVLGAVEAQRETAASIVPAAPAAPDGAASAPPVPATPVPVPGPMIVEAGAGTLEERRVPLTGSRKTIARRLVESKTTIPHYQVTMSFSMDTLLDLRKTLNGQLADQGVKLSVNDFLIRACALAMYENPEFNASWTDDAIVIHGSVNIGVAIALPAERGGGLLVATIRDADKKSLRAISLEARALSEKARTRGLTVEEMSDSTFTISNLGMFGVEHFTAIINPPNSAILAVGAAVQKPVVRDGELAIGSEMAATLSSDHRVIDGAMAARYLETLKHLLEQPATLMV
jgi:pyruvate dehydrogenase E2 component (dihydrolipoamide acetyltransferase)